MIPRSNPKENPQSSMTPPTLAILYGRVSTHTQKASLDAQDQKGLDYARKHDLIIPPDNIILEEISSRVPMFQRTEARRIPAIIQAGQAQHLIVSSPDRLGGDAADMAANWKWFRE